MAPKSDPRDPRFRPFRIAVYALYVAVGAVFCAFVTISVVRSVVAMSPRAAGSAGELLPAHRCVAEAEALWRMLDDERKQFTRHQPAKGVDEAFSHFRVEWLRRLRELEGRCVANVPGRQSLREVFRRLERVQDLYTTHAVQYAGEVGPAVDALVAAMAKARESER